jgi:glycosyltransferase involved in cell wall biosynthesis
MKIAYFSPFPPKQTGIATYSKSLVPELRKLFRVDAFDIGNDAASDASMAFGDFSRDGIVSDLTRYDAVIYHLGNNPHFHLEIYRTLRQFSGIVVLHDVVLYYLFAGTGKAGLTKHFLLNYGVERLREIDQIIADSTEGDILRYRYPAKYPMIGSIFPYATRIIVHNQWAKIAIRSLGYTRPIHVVPLLSYHQPRAPASAASELRKRHRISEGDFVIGCFGFIGPTKRMAQVCAALAAIREKVSFKLLIVGEGDDLRPMIATAGLREKTLQLNFVSDKDFIALLEMTDVVVNLRYPSMGESSATLTQAMSLAKPCIITNDASFRDLPDDCVVKIDLGETEVSDLASAISELAASPTRRESLGKAAKTFIADNLCPAKIAHQFQAVVEAEVKEQARRTLLADADDIQTAETVAHLFRQSLLERLPTHLKQGVYEATREAPRRHVGLTEDEIRWTYRITLGREPENEAKVEEIMANVHDLPTLLNQMLNSDEYRRLQETSSNESR